MVGSFPYADSLIMFGCRDTNKDALLTECSADNLIANNGWAYFNIPSCLAPGQYLMRVEIIALHSAYSANGAQFYSSCLQLNVGGSGSSTPSPAVSFPFYKQNDPGIQTNIYGAAGAADNGGKAYAAPGPAVATC